MACHRRIEQRLDTLVHAAGHLGKDRAVALNAIRTSLKFLDTSGMLHTKDEEESLFPRLRRSLSAAELAFVDSLEQQHGKAEAIYSELKDLVQLLGATGESSSELIERYLDCAKELRNFYGDHIKAEDEILTVLARRCLTGDEISEISSEMRTRRANAPDLSSVVVLRAGFDTIHKQIERPANRE